MQCVHERASAGDDGGCAPVVDCRFGEAFLGDAVVAVPAGHDGHEAGVGEYVAACVGEVDCAVDAGVVHEA